MMMMINGNCFILSGYINLPVDICSVGLFWPFDLWPWHYDSYRENLTDLYHPNIVQDSTQKLYMIAVLYFESRSILHETCTLSCYFDLWTFHLQNMTFNLKFCSDHNSKKWQLLHIFRAYQSAIGPLHSWVILTFWPWHHHYLEKPVWLSAWKL